MGLAMITTSAKTNMWTMSGPLDEFSAESLSGQGDSTIAGVFVDKGEGDNIDFGFDDPARCLFEE